MATESRVQSARRTSSRRVIATVGALVAIGAVAFVAAGHSSAEAPMPAEKKPAPAPLPVQIRVVTSEAYAPIVSGTGSLLPNEAVDLSAELARKLVTVAVEDGQVVAAGQVLFELDTRDILAQIARLRAQSRYARASFGRYSSLSESGSVSADDRDSSKLKVDDVNAQIRELEIQLEKTRVVAPFAGTFGLRPVSVGAWVAPGTPLGRLVDVSTLKLDFRLPERHAMDVAIGSEVSFMIDGRPDTFRGTVSAIDPAIDRTSRSVVVRAKVLEPRGILPGTFATVAVPLAKRDALFVPAIAVIPAPTGARVFVDRSGVATEVQVDAGVREPARVEIVKGLVPGDRVIITNLLRIRNGAPIREVASDTKAPAALPGAAVSPPAALPGAAVSPPAALPGAAVSPPAALPGAAETKP